MSPPMIGPDITLQRPSVSTPNLSQPRNSFPGTAENPFAQLTTSRGLGTSRGIDSGKASPGHRGTPQPPDDSRPGRTLSRAAQTYTPVTQTTPQPTETNRSAQPTSRLNNVSSTGNRSTSRREESRTRSRSPSRDAPSPSRRVSPNEAMSQAESEANRRNMQAPTAIPGHMQSTIPKSVPESQASPEPMRIPRTDPRASPEPMRIPQAVRPNGSMNQSQVSRPEMTQESTNRGAFVPPFMPSPDIRPPSDDSLPGRQYGQLRGYIARDDAAPSMPNLIIPSPQNNSSNVKSVEDRPTRPRSPSVGETDKPRARRASPTPVNSHKRSVSFNPRLDFNEAPKNRHETSESDNDSLDTARRQRHEREREKDRDRDRDHHSHRDKDRRGYDAGDDFSDDTPFEDHRRRSRDSGDKDRDRKSSRRERSNTQSLDRDQDRDRNEDRHDKPKRSSTMTGSSHHHRRNRDESPGSDETEYLPDRFDERGRQKSGSSGRKSDRSTDQDLLAQSLDQILGGIFGKGKK